MLFAYAIGDGVFPAPAGINRRPGRYLFAPARVPRASGDKPQKTERLSQLV